MAPRTKLLLLLPAAAAAALLLLAGAAEAKPEARAAAAADPEADPGADPEADAQDPSDQFYDDYEGGDYYSKILILIPISMWKNSTKLSSIIR